MATIKIKKVKSSIRTHRRQQRTLEALGLHRMNQVVEHKDSAVLRGMIAKAQHLVQVEEGK